MNELVDGICLFVGIMTSIVTWIVLSPPASEYERKELLRRNK